MTTVHAKNQIFILNFAELHFLKTIVQIWVQNCTTNYLTQ